MQSYEFIVINCLLSMNNVWIIRALFFCSALTTFLILERWISFRKPVQSKIERAITNIGIGIINGFLLAVTIGILLTHSHEFFLFNKMGLLNQWGWPSSLNFLLTLIILDFALYVWHIANHKFPFLWRFHKVHHSDLDIDVTTASRFHIGELFISSLLKIVLIFLIGPSYKVLFTFDIVFLLFAQFNHANIRMNRRIEGILEFFIVTPFIHRSHHSADIFETNSNYGTIFSFWDKLFRTFRLKQDQDKIKIGLEEFQDRRELTFKKLWTMPLTNRGYQRSK